MQWIAAAKSMIGIHPQYALKSCESAMIMRSPRNSDIVVTSANAVTPPPAVTSPDSLTDVNVCVDEV